MIEKNTLNNLIKEGYSIRKIAKKLQRSPTSVRHWLKKFNLNQ